MRLIWALISLQTRASPLLRPPAVGTQIHNSRDLSFQTATVATSYFLPTARRLMPVIREIPLPQIFSGFHAPLARGLTSVRWNPSPCHSSDSNQPKTLFSSPSEQRWVIPVRLRLRMTSDIGRQCSKRRLPPNIDIHPGETPATAFIESVNSRIAKLHVGHNHLASELDSQALAIAFLPALLRRNNRLNGQRA
jgi:hypothetical protein